MAFQSDDGEQVSTKVPPAKRSVQLRIRATLNQYAKRSVQLRIRATLHQYASCAMLGAMPDAADLHCVLAFMCCMSACEQIITTSV